MAFRFALAALLRLRHSIERQRTLSLQDAALQLGRARDTLARLELFLVESAINDASLLAAGKTAAELQFASLSREQFENFRHQMKQEVHRREELHHRAVEDYQQALREREVLETLRARQRRVYQLEQGRRQQQELDANYLLRRWRQDG